MPDRRSDPTPSDNLRRVAEVQCRCGASLGGSRPPTEAALLSQRASMTRAIVRLLGEFHPIPGKTEPCFLVVRAYSLCGLLPAFLRLFAEPIGICLCHGDGNNAQK